ncbi:zinc-binding protein A33-like [Xiphophorus maculatus]|uniref:zinc-binding protein A33-like n=1 Tax=Xiphophorus maculatus TaxID=8083 RepID=UPI000C6E4E22|nr:zinc-binding protein A33-like [Xiphophorus maculatus]
MCYLVPPPFLQVCTLIIQSFDRTADTGQSTGIFQRRSASLFCLLKVKMLLQSEKDLTCTLCCDIFSDPVKLECSHSFCSGCLQTDWAQKRTRLCPLCRETSLLRDPPADLVMKNLCFAFFLGRGQRGPAGSEALCSLHSEQLKLFCLDHEKPVCLVCRDSKAHSGHSFRPVQEAVQDRRDELQNQLEPLKEKLTRFREVQGKCDETAEHIKIQADRIEKQIKEQIKELHQFLQEEEEERVRAVREEEEQKRQAMKENMEALRKNMEDLSQTVTTAEEEFRCSEDVLLLLQNYKAAKGRVQQCPLLDEPQPLPGALVDEAKHLGNLSYKIWTKMKRMVSFSPVVLDPNTAEPHLSVSADLTAVTFGPRQELPGNPERFEQRHCVIGHQGFSSGTHSWDVEVRTEEFWGVGVLSESVSRKGQIQAGFWGICLSDGSYAATSCAVPSTALPVTKLHRIRVQLDWEEGKVSFFDLDANNHLHTFKHTFTEKLFAYICTKNASPLKILPAARYPDEPL